MGHYSHTRPRSCLLPHTPRAQEMEIKSNSFTTRKSVKSCQKYLSLIDEAPGSNDELQQKRPGLQIEYYIRNVSASGQYAWTGVKCGEKQIVRIMNTDILSGRQLARKNEHLTTAA